MNNTLQWPADSVPVWLIAALGVAIVLNLVIVLPRRAGAARKALVLFLNVGCVLALWAFLSPPSLVRGGTSAMLVTPGASPQALARAARAPAAFALPGVMLAGAAARQIKPVPDLAALRRAHPEVNRLSVVGAGLVGEQWRESGGWAIDFRPSPAPQGFMNVRWPDRLVAGEPLHVTGSVHLTAASEATVRLVDPAGTVVASQPLRRSAAGAALPFELDSPVRASGRYVFALRLDNAAGEILAAEQIPVSIQNPQAVRILVLLSSPSFELRAMINWARQSGASLAVRTAISRDRHRTVFYRQPPVNIDSLHAAVLNTFDIVVSDVRQWRALADDDRDAVAQAVLSNGLGLLLVVRDRAASVDDALPWPGYTLLEREAQAVDLIEDRSAPALLANTAGLVVGNASKALVHDRQVRTVAAWRNHGSGKLAVTLVTDSYALITAGHADAHARYWQTLIEGTRKPRASVGFRVAPRLPVVDWRLQVCAYGEATAVAAAAFNGKPLALIEPPLSPGQRCGYTWPGQAGWQRLEVAGHTRDVFVYPGDAWRTERHLTRTADTRLAAQRPPGLRNDGKSSPKPLPRWWFFLAFVGTAGLLWLEQKAAPASG